MLFSAKKATASDSLERCRRFWNQIRPNCYCGTLASSFPSGP